MATDQKANRDSRDNVGQKAGQSRMVCEVGHGTIVVVPSHLTPTTQNPSSVRAPKLSRVAKPQRKRSSRRPVGVLPAGAFKVLAAIKDRELARRPTVQAAAASQGARP